MAKRQHAHPTPWWPDTNPYFYPPWREEFNSRASWGRHPAASGPNRAWHGGDCGPSPKQGFYEEHHPGDDS